MRIYLEIARQNNTAHRRFHAQGVALRYGVADGEEMKRHIPQREHFLRLHGAQAHTVRQPPFLELVLHESQREGRTVYGRPPELGNNPGKRSYVILMPVRQHNPKKVVFHCLDSAEVRNKHVHAQMFIARKHKAAVHHDHTPGRFQELTVQTDLTKSPQGGNRQFCFRHILFLYSVLPKANQGGTRP